MIQVRNYVEKLIGADDTTFNNILEQLSVQLSQNEPSPFSFFVQASIRNAVKPFVSDSLRDHKFQRLLDFGLTAIASESCKQVSDCLPSEINDIEVHIFPSVDGYGGGCTIAPGKILVCVKVDDLAPVRLQRNIAHEYSHGVRMTRKPQATEHGYGREVPYTVRDYVVFEGLAMMTSEVMYPAPIAPLELSEEAEESWWNTVDLDATGIGGYVEYINEKTYEIGRRIIRAYMQNNGVSISEAHTLNDEVLYWNSVYAKIK